MQSKTTCRICGQQCSNELFSVREMMLGTRERFDYFRCSNCGCLQIAQYPADIAKYYPENYYSFATINTSPPRLRTFLKEARDNYVVTGSGALGRLLSLITPLSRFAGIGRVRLPRDAKILDVGCGAGLLLYGLHRLGYSDLTGVDPFLDEHRDLAPGVRLLKADLEHTQGSFDFVMLNHSFEHMPDQHQQMAHIRRLLSPGGMCMIRVPVASSYAWETYHANWVQLDAPRHYYLHTHASLQVLAQRAQLAICDVMYDSDGFQLYGSELYKKDVPLRDFPSRLPETFSRLQRRKFDAQARRLNAQQQGDQAAFYFRKAPVAC